jgi:hypothetical protein
VDGERLRLQADAPGRGSPGEKFVPYSTAENVERLLPQLSDLTSRLRNTQPGLLGELPILEIRLLPQFLAASSFPFALFEQAGFTPVGTRRGSSQTPNKDGDIIDDVPTKSVFVAASRPLDQLDNILRTAGAGFAKRVGSDIQSIDSLTLAEPTLVLYEESSDRLQRLQLFESVFHPSVDRTGSAVPATGDVIDKWLRLVDGIGGTVDPQWLRTSGTSTFLPTRIEAEAVPELVQFNPLRSIQPMPAPRELPEVETELWPYDPPALTPARPGNRPLRVAVFDGGVNTASPF